MGGLPDELIPDSHVRTPNRGVAIRRPQIEHIMRGRRAAPPDHHCGDDLVYTVWNTHANQFK